MGEAGFSAAWDGTDVATKLELAVTVRSVIFSLSSTEHFYWRRFGPPQCKCIYSNWLWASKHFV